MTTPTPGTEAEKIRHALQDAAAEMERQFRMFGDTVRAVVDRYAHPAPDLARDDDTQSEVGKHELAERITEAMETAHARRYNAPGDYWDAPDLAFYADAALSVVQPELDRLRSELADMTTQRDTYREGWGRAVDSLEQKLSATRAERDVIRCDRDTAQAEVKALREKLERVDKELEAGRRARRRLHKRVVTLGKENFKLLDATAQRDALQARIAAALGLCDRDGWGTNLERAQRLTNRGDLADEFREALTPAPADDGSEEIPEWVQRLDEWDEDDGSEARAEGGVADLLEKTTGTRPKSVTIGDESPPFTVGDYVRDADGYVWKVLGCHRDGGSWMVQRKHGDWFGTQCASTLEPWQPRHGERVTGETRDGETVTGEFQRCSNKLDEAAVYSRLLIRFVAASSLRPDVGSEQ